MKHVHAFQIELEFGSVGFCGEGKTRETGEKPLRTRERTNNKLNPHMASTSGFEPGPHWWEASALTTVTPFLPLSYLLIVNGPNLGGAIYSTKIPTSLTGKSGPPQKVDQFFRKFSGRTEPIH